MPSFKSVIKRTLISIGVPPHKLPYVTPALIDPYEIDKDLLIEYDHIATRTVVDRKRVAMLKQFAVAAKPVDGEIAEVGVYRGGTAWLIAKQFQSTGKAVHLFDTFEGMPDTKVGVDLHKPGDFDDTSLNDVKYFMKDFPNTFFYPGFFPTTANPIKEKKFCFVHIDLDIYQSIFDCCSFFYGRMTTGGFFVFDDYGFLSCPGAKSATDDFFKDKPESVIALPTGQALVIKL